MTRRSARSARRASTHQPNGLIDRGEEPPRVVLAGIRHRQVAALEPERARTEIVQPAATNQLRVDGGELAAERRVCPSAEARPR